MANVLKRDQACEKWLEEIKSRPRPRMLLEYFAANIARHNNNNNSKSTEAGQNNNADHQVATSFADASSSASKSSTSETSATTSTNSTIFTSTISSPTSLDHLLMYCRHCTATGVEGTARAFLAAPPPQIIFCSNRLRNTKDMEDVFVHEMVHAVDYCTRDMDITQCEALACSEIRAAREAECLSSIVPKWNGEKINVPWPVQMFTKEGCVMSNATTATQAMFPGDVGAACVKKMFDQCYRDTVPFDDIET